MASALLVLGIIAILATPNLAQAHCPLCTVGAGAVAAGAAWLGVSAVAVGILIGAFAYALSVWTARLITKRLIPYQNAVVGTVVFLATVIPVVPLIREYAPLYISVAGEYGTLLHNTYAINLFLVGLPIGALLVCGAPIISASLTRQFGRQIVPFQGVSITLGALVATSFIVELIA